MAVRGDGLADEDSVPDERDASERRDFVPELRRLESRPSPATIFLVSTQKSGSPTTETTLVRGASGAYSAM